MRLRWWPRSRAVILLYHRIAEPVSDPWSLAVTPAHFAEHLEVLCREARPLPLRDLAKALPEGKLPRRSVAVTFDDGYADTLYAARPLLERYGVPATVFVTTGALGGELWWNELDRRLLRSAAPEDLERFRGWRAWEEPPTPRHALYRRLWDRLRPLGGEERSRALEELRTSDGAAPDARLMTAGEVAGLGRDNLVEIGAHTETHPVLAALPPAGQRAEIEGSRTRLQEILGRPVESFAYPFGGRADATEETAAIVREAGFARACVNFRGPVGRSTDLYQLPRAYVHDCAGDVFAGRLSAWMEHGG